MEDVLNAQPERWYYILLTWPFHMALRTRLVTREMFEVRSGMASGPVGPDGLLALGATKVPQVAGDLHVNCRINADFLSIEDARGHGRHGVREAPGAAVTRPLAGWRECLLSPGKTLRASSGRLNRRVEETVDRKKFQPHNTLLSTEKTGLA